MKYFLENTKRYIYYMYLVIINKRLINKIYQTLSLTEKKLFNDENTIFNQIGENVLHNNKWGEYKLKKNEKYFQDIFKLDNKFGWKFITQNKNRGVIGYPEIFTGKSPFGGESTNTKLPLQIKNLNKLIIDYNVSMYVEPKKYNLAFDLWITSDKNSSVKNITNEIMIWEDRNVSMPAGKYVGKIYTSFGTYRLYHGWMDRTSENLGIDGWYFTAFVRQDRRRQGQVNIKELIDFMLSKNLLNEKKFISTIEFGNEVYNASGYTIINDYQINLD